MKEAVQFLSALAHAISTLGLYKPGHPSRERAVDTAWEALVRLQEREPTPNFTLLGEEVLMGALPLRALRGWEWGIRFSDAGVQRLEFTGSVARDDLDVFLEEVRGRLVGDPVDTSEARQSRPTQIRFGAVGLKDDTGGEVEDLPTLTTATLGYDLKEEVEAVEWIHKELKGRNRLNLLEAEAIVRSLTVAMHGDQEFVIPLLRMKDFDQYTTTHAMNVAVLAMALAEYIGLGPREVRSFGISGLLHDLGKVTIDDEILNKPGKLTDAERAVMNNHSAEGARMILEAEEHLDLAAIVAYEHHIKLNGTGYPVLKHPRKCHLASDLVHVCDVYDALRTHRPYRGAWGQARVLDYLEVGVGTEFDPGLTRAFVGMMRNWEARVAHLERPDQRLAGAGTAREPTLPPAAAGETP
ncbi:MAG TPA: HD domain-containing phosphohydrolase [Longimicrobiales bacterium]|nr:HD domain-containing phosphohydrolase [Longimicrobiales bacterium]